MVGSWPLRVESIVARTTSRRGTTRSCEPDTEPNASFLLTWNPERWDRATLADDLVHVALGRAVEIRHFLTSKK